MERPGGVEKGRGAKRYDEIDDSGSSRDKYSTLWGYQQAIDYKRNRNTSASPSSWRWKKGSARGFPRLAQEDSVLERDEKRPCQACLDVGVRAGPGQAGPGSVWQQSSELCLRLRLCLCRCLCLTVRLCALPLCAWTGRDGPGALRLSRHGDECRPLTCHCPERWERSQGASAAGCWTGVTTGLDWRHLAQGAALLCLRACPGLKRLGIPHTAPCPFRPSRKNRSSPRVVLFLAQRRLCIIIVTIVIIVIVRTGSR